MSNMAGMTLGLTGSQILQVCDIAGLGNVHDYAFPPRELLKGKISKSKQTSPPKSGGRAIRLRLIVRRIRTKLGAKSTSLIRPQNLVRRSRRGSLLTSEAETKDVSRETRAH